MRCFGICIGLLVFLVFSVVLRADDEESRKKPPEELVAPETHRQLGRVPGQTEFLNFDQIRMVTRAASALESVSTDESPGSGGQREIQDSDIVKVGKNKLLFLLNRFRGLQIIDSSGGADNPRLLSWLRVGLHSFPPENMYIDQKRKRLIILKRSENLGGDGSYRPMSEVVVVSFANPAEPEVLQTQMLEGEVADSRLVGDVLYVAASTREHVPRGYSWGTAGESGGKVYSLRANEKGVEQIQALDLNLPASRRENMGIIEVQGEKGYEYYLTAVLSSSGWGWWDRQSIVEVVDVTDPNGKMESILVAHPRGRVDKRQFATIEKGHLIVASNYQAGAKGRGLWRVALESFRLRPKNEQSVISGAEADSREAQIRAALEDKTDEELETLRPQLETTGQTQLSGLFVRDSQGGPYQMLVPTSYQTTGDTTGQSLTLQDARFEKGFCYAFSVPRNLVDPLDVFDVSDPEDLKFLKRLEFGGWIQRAIPQTLKTEEGETRLIIGLGRIQPAANNESRRQYPQIMIFEVGKHRNKLHLYEIAQKVFREKNAWTRFGDQDRMIDIRWHSETEATILFQISQWTEDGLVQGGKLIDVNLQAALDGNEDQIFTEGGVLIGDASYLRRVFHDAPLKRYRAFSNKRLFTFPKTAGRASHAQTIIEAVHELELARNIQATATVPLAQSGELIGVQIISEPAMNYYYGSEPGESKTRLRLAPASNLDADREQTIREIELAGNYDSHLVLEDRNSILVITREFFQEESEQDRQPWKTRYQTYCIELTGTSTNPRFGDPIQNQWEREGTTSGWHGGWGADARLSAPETLTRIGQNEVTFSDGEGLTLLRFAENGVQIIPMTINGLGTLGEVDPERFGPSIHQLGGSVYVSWREVQQVQDYTLIVRQFIAKATPTNGAKKTWKLGKPINIPGTPIRLSEKGHLVTSDSVLVDSPLLDFMANHPRASFPGKVSNRLETQLSSLSLKGGVATYHAGFAIGYEDLSELQAAGNQLVFLTREERQQDYWSGPGILGGYGGRQRGTSPVLTFLSFDREFKFVRTVRAVRGLSTNQFTSLTHVLTDPNDSAKHYAILSEGWSGVSYLVSWDGRLLPYAQAVRPVREDGTLGEPTDWIDLPPAIRWSWGSKSQQMNLFTQPGSGETSLVLAGGDFGAFQFQLTQEAIRAAQE